LGSVDSGANVTRATRSSPYGSERTPVHAVPQKDPAADLRGALAPIKVTNRAAITEPREVAQLLRALHGYSGHYVVEAAIKLAPLVFVRRGELRAAEWTEFDFDASE